jgi:hypothetical protein
MSEVDLPGRLLKLALDSKGRVVPWFVEEPPEGKEWDFRVASGRKFWRAIKEKLCWVCGERLGKYKVFLLGPMCVVTRTTAEPPCHLECATYSVRACPFLSSPKMHRREAGLPQEVHMPGVGLKRNPGVVALWTAFDYRLFDGQPGVLIRVGEAVGRLLWYCEGRAATRAEVIASFDAGLPALRELAQAQAELGALEDLENKVAVALELVPA